MRHARRQIARTRPDELIRSRARNKTAFYSSRKSSQTPVFAAKYDTSAIEGRTVSPFIYTMIIKSFVKLHLWKLQEDECSGYSLFPPIMLPTMFPTVTTDGS